jgi:hypothetical protein
MLAGWIYNQPTWIVGSLIVGLFVLVSCLGLVVVHRVVPVKIRRSHNDIVGFTIAVVGVVHAVLLAFIAVATGRHSGKAFGPPDFKMHALITGMLAAFLAVVMVLIVALDYPFRGSLSVSDKAFIAVRKNMETLVIQPKATGSRGDWGAAAIDGGSVQAKASAPGLLLDRALDPFRRRSRSRPPSPVALRHF